MSDDVVLRPVSAADIPVLRRIQAAWPDSVRWTEANFKAELDSARSLGTAAVADAAVVGFVFLWIVADEGQIADIAVERSRARRGIGRRLLRHALEQARGRGCVQVTLEVGADNPAALALYRSEGFSVVGRRSKIYNAVEDAVLMTRRF